MLSSMMFSRRLGQAAKRTFTSSVSMQMGCVSEIKKVGVVGLGLMGHGIAQISAVNGYQVVAVESSAEALDKGMARISGSLDKMLKKEASKGIITEAQVKDKKEEIWNRINPTTHLSDAHQSDLIVEAIVEKMDVKLDFYKNLATVIKPDAIFASNTSSLQITAMGDVSGRKENFVGLHFFNPVQIMKLCEIIRTEHTTDAAYNLVKSYVEKIKKVGVTCPDTPGFIVNRLLVPFMAQALVMHDKKIATTIDIDTGMRLGAGHPMGPLMLADYVGLDTCLSILRGWKEVYPDEPAFVVPDNLVRKVEAGDFGRKSGKGFYTWDGDVVNKPVEEDE